MPPILFAAVRFTFAGVLLLVLLRLVEPESRLRRGDFLPVLGLGVTLTQSVFTIGVSMTTAPDTALIYSAAPVWGCCSGSPSRWRSRVFRASWGSRRADRAATGCR